jgi:hypothetical protein
MHSGIQEVLINRFTEALSKSKMQILEQHSLKGPQVVQGELPCQMYLQTGK